MHRFQHIYFVVLYALMYLYWVFVSDYRKYFRKKIHNTPLKKMSTSDHVRFWGVKLFHAAVFIVIPIMAVGFVKWLAGFLIMGLVSGFILSIVFQLAHTVEDADFPEVIEPAHVMPDEFAAHQLKTTANFATQNRLVSWLVGGLNFQVEHHLFPKISHVHYPAISKIVKQVCMEYDMPYIEYKSTGSAIKAHLNFLKRMGAAA